MTNKDKYNDTFKTVFDLKEDEINKAKYKETPEWDSVGHMSLIIALESAFSIKFKTEDILVFDCYEKGKEIMNKYGIVL